MSQDMVSICTMQDMDGMDIVYRTAWTWTSFIKRSSISADAASCSPLSQDMVLTCAAQDIDGMALKAMYRTGSSGMDALHCLLRCVHNLADLADLSASLTV